MNPTPTTRGRHALRWVLGVGLVFVVVIAMSLQAARRRADERWETVIVMWDEYRREVRPEVAFRLGRETRGGTVFRAWRRVQLSSLHLNMALRQERDFFGSSIEVRMSEFWPSGYLRRIRSLFAEVDVELVVER